MGTGSEQVRVDCPRLYHAVRHRLLDANELLLDMHRAGAHFILHTSYILTGLQKSK